MMLWTCVFYGESALCAKTEASKESTYIPDPLSSTLKSSMDELSLLGPTAHITSSPAGSQQTAVMGPGCSHAPRRMARRLRILG